MSSLKSGLGFMDGDGHQQLLQQESMSEEQMLKELEVS